MWIARRSYKKPTFPGMLDNIVGGGLSKGTPLENAIKECKEEASITDELCKNLKATGAVMFWYQGEKTPESRTAHTEFTYDIELPDDFQPIPCDGEVEEFYLWTIPRVTEHLLNAEFTPEVL